MLLCFSRRSQLKIWFQICEWRLGFVPIRWRAKLWASGLLSAGVDILEQGNGWIAKNKSQKYVLGCYSKTWCRVQCGARVCWQRVRVHARNRRWGAPFSCDAGKYLLIYILRQFHALHVLYMYLQITPPPPSSFFEIASSTLAAFLHSLGKWFRDRQRICGLNFYVRSRRSSAAPWCCHSITKAAEESDRCDQAPPASSNRWWSQRWWERKNIYIIIVF